MTSGGDNRNWMYNINDPYLKRYGIEWKLSYKHLLTVVLYCDYSELSSDFSRSFRKVNRFETIRSVKARNSKYYYFAKYLRECVECFGECSIGVRHYWYAHSMFGKKCSAKRSRVLSGPFYCGMSILMNMPSFNIRLCAPTSTTMHIEVATKFSTEEGMIIQFNNSDEQYQYLKGFDVSWISRYKEEEERLFIGGFYYMKIESVRVRATNDNYEKIIRSLCYLDIIITGGNEYMVKRSKIGKNGVLVIENLFNHALNKETSITLDRYIYDSFASFTHNKTQIVLDFHGLKHANKEIRDLIVHEFKSTKTAKKKSNLLRLEMLLIFKNVNTIIITANASHDVDQEGWGPDYTYREQHSISIGGLLSLMDSRSLDKVVVKAESHKSRWNNWIYSLWEEKEETISKLCYAKGYSIAMDIIEEYTDDEDSVESHYTYAFIIYKQK
eukprot:115665_1